MYLLIRLANILKTVNTFANDSEYALKKLLWGIFVESLQL